MKAQDLIDASNCGIVGIDDGLKIYGGYDNAFDRAGANPVEFDPLIHTNRRQLPGRRKGA